jgi:serine protease AprX
MSGKLTSRRPHGGVLHPARRWVGGLAMLLVAGALTALPPQAATAELVQANADDRADSVVVTGTDADASARQVRLAGGTVTAKLAIVDGVVAELPEGARLPSGYSVVPDRSVSFASETPSEVTKAALVRETVGLAPTGTEGAGVTVALVDTGVADVDDLSGRLDHIDVTGTGPGDGYGHGTYLAGVIAGSGAASGGRYQGVAPQARILDVKVADSTGVTSLSLVLEGLQQVANTAGRYGTKVVNLSLASGSPMPYQVDPLNQALRTLWHRGLTVVVASGNDGPQSGTVASPGNDPTLLTAGGLADAYSAARTDDSVAAFSGRGPTNQGVQKPDLVAPGAHVVGLRSPGSHVDVAYPHARVDDDHVRASGTSASAAVTSAAIAGILSVNPELSPDQLKYLVTETAYREGDLSVSTGAGAGGLDLRAAFQAADSPKVRRIAAKPTAAPGSAEQWASLADAFADGDRRGVAEAWRQLTPAARSWAARSWATLDPVARSWAARSWAATSWGDGETSSQEWAARSWAARSWAGEDWAARSWAGDDWVARSWASGDWVARSWAGDDWVARSWANDAWSARSWASAWR